MESMWNTGLIKLFNPERGTGVIEQYDGLELVFNQADLLIQSQSTPLEAGAKVLYQLTKTEYGLQAREITVLKAAEG